MEGNQSSNVIAALDIGSSKISVAVAEVIDNEHLNVIGFGKVPSEGVFQGSIQDVEKAVNSIRSAVNEAETTSGQPIKHIVAALSGKNLHCLNPTGKLVLSNSEVTTEDITRVTRLAMQFDPKSEDNTKSPDFSDDDRVVMHTIKGYTIDGDTTMIDDPTGSAGKVLKAHVHLAVGSDSIVLNLVRSIRKAGLDLDGLIMRPWASAASCITATEKELGVILLDIGEGTTDIACYRAGQVDYTAVAVYGGNLFTRDIAAVLKCSLADAEEIKRTYGHFGVRPEDSMVQIRYTCEVDGIDRSVACEEVIHILEARASELINRIGSDHLNHNSWLKRAAGGIVITGGVANMPGFAEFMSNIWGLPVRIGVPTLVKSATVQLIDPEDATVMGVLVESIKRRKTTGKISKMTDNSFMSWLKHVLFGDFYE